MEYLAMHPGIVSLDVGDCHLHDEGVSLLCGLLQTDGAKPGKIYASGWDGVDGVGRVGGVMECRSPGIVNLDVGDFHQQDEWVSLMCVLLQTLSAKPGRYMGWGGKGVMKSLAMQVLGSSIWTYGELSSAWMNGCH